MNKNIYFAIILLLFLKANVVRTKSFNLFQVKYSSWGGVDADEDEFYDPVFERGYGARLIVKNFYFSVQKNYTAIDQDIPDAIVETIALGLAFNRKSEINDDLNGYLIAGVGAGSGKFSVKNPIQMIANLL